MLDADAYIVPTDAFGNVERQWAWAVGAEAGGRARQLHHCRESLTADGFVWVDGDTAEPVLALDVAGDGVNGGVGAMVERFSIALTMLDSASLRGQFRARPLVAMPLIGVGRAGFGGRTGEIIARLLDAVDQYFTTSASGGFDLAIATLESSSIAALQHERRAREDRSGPQEVPEWLADLVSAARSRQLAVMFGAGASAALGLPLWGGLLGQLVAALDDTDLDPVDLAALDPTDAATLLIEAGGAEWFSTTLTALLRAPRHSLMHGLLANLRSPLAITTNYDQAFELATQAVFGSKAVVLPWDLDQGTGARVLKLPGDLTRGQLVLSRDQFVAMHAYRRPLAGVLQSRMLIGHLLTVGTSMSDTTLVHAAEEFHALIRQARDVTTPTSRSNAGTVILTTPDPARARLLSRAFTVVSADGHHGVQESARDIDVLLDWLVMQASDDLSFALDPRYAALLTPADQDLATALRSLASEESENLADDSSDLAMAVSRFLHSLGLRKTKED